jgi:hypothetical protein
LREYFLCTLSVEAAPSRHPAEASTSLRAQPTARTILPTELPCSTVASALAASRSG